MAASPARSARRVLPWALLSLLLGAVAVILAVVRFDALPDPYPTHFGFGGEPDAFGARTYGPVLIPVISGQLGALAVMATALATPARMPRMAQGLGALGAVIGGGTALLSISQNLSKDAVPPVWGTWVFLGAVLVALVWLVVASVRASRPSDDEQDREHWKWGIVYVNPDEPDVFVPKRIGTGATINFGRPLGWLVFALILAPGIALITIVVLVT